MSAYKINNDDFLYRRIPKKNPFCWKEVDGKKIPSSANFKTDKGEDGLSVNIAKLTTPEKTAIDTNDFAVAEFSASTPIELGYKCEHNPKPDNDAHALIVGDTKPIAKKLSKAITQVFHF